MNFFEVLISCFTDKRFIIVFFITVFIYFLAAVASPLRFAGIKMGLLSTSFSFFNVLSLISRLANLLQTPFLGSMVDIAFKTNQLDQLKIKLHLIIVASSLGYILGFFFFSTFEKIFYKWLEIFDKQKSLLRTFFYFFDFRTWIFIFRSLSLPRFGLDMVYLKRVPLLIWVSSTLISAFWTTGVLSAMYASVIVPEFARTATILSGVINGVATILFTIFLDPIIANITDKVYNSSEKIEYLYNVVWAVMVSTVIGTVLAHLVFYPGAVIIAKVTLIFSKI